MKDDDFATLPETKMQYYIAAREANQARIQAEVAAQQAAQVFNKINMLENLLSQQCSVSEKLTPEVEVWYRNYKYHELNGGKKK